MYPLLPDRLDTLLLGEGFLPAILATAGAFDPPELASFVPFGFGFASNAPPPLRQDQRLQL